MKKNYTPLQIDEFKKNYQSFNKETEPRIKKETNLLQEKVEHEIEDKEVKPYVNIKSETIKLPVDIKKIEVEVPTKPPRFFKYESVKLPISDEKLIIGLKAPITSSLRWLATLAIYILKMAQFQLKIKKTKYQELFRL